MLEEVLPGFFTNQKYIFQQFLLRKIFLFSLILFFFDRNNLEIDVYLVFFLNV